jgi:hypothetical protein
VLLDGFGLFKDCRVFVIRLLIEGMPERDGAIPTVGGQDGVILIEDNAWR